MCEGSKIRGLNYSFCAIRITKALTLKYKTNHTELN